MCVLQLLLGLLCPSKNKHATLELGCTVARHGLLQLPLQQHSWLIISHPALAQTTKGSLFHHMLSSAAVLAGITAALALLDSMLPEISPANRPLLPTE
jgi:hypothetical protein